uniref:Uncharacterized protein n=1 Tax=Corvus moneduloides TaxID=1196302 RepID=A0A8U7N6Q8_CORMO
SAGGGGSPSRVGLLQGDLSPGERAAGDGVKGCRELRGFIRPLAELLEGLRRGRYDRGLSSFQQSVAMDRLQRIIGVLQKPEMGARYLGTLLQVEAMLRLWFPHVAPKPALDPAPSARPGARTGPAQSPRVPPGAAAPNPGPAPPEVPADRKSLPPEVPPSAASGRGAERPRLHRGQLGTGPGPGPRLFGRGPTGSGLTKDQPGAGGAAGQGQRPAKTVRGAGDPRCVPLGLCGADRALRVPGSGVGRTGPSLSRGFPSRRVPGRGQEGLAPRSAGAARSQPPRPAAVRPWRTTCASWAAP